MIGKTVEINGKVGKVIGEKGRYILVEFKFGKFVFNKEGKIKVLDKEIK